MPVVAVTVSITVVIAVSVAAAITVAIPIPIPVFHDSCTGCGGVFDLSSAHRRRPRPGNSETNEAKTCDGSKNGNAHFPLPFSIVVVVAILPGRSQPTKNADVRSEFQNAFCRAAISTAVRFKVGSLSSPP
jgi:hypothetical protein